MTSLVDTSEIVWNTHGPTPKSPKSQEDALFNIDLHAVISSLVWRKQRTDSTVIPVSDQKLGEALVETAPWLASLTSEQGYVQVMDHSALAQEGGVFPADHLFRGMACKGMVEDTRVLLKHVKTADKAILDVVVVTQLGSDVCGHAGIVHGGLTAALIDETYGYLLYIAKGKGILEFDAAFTANLEVAYKQPLLPNRPVSITAWIKNTEGRKVWVEAVVSDKPLMRLAEGGEPVATPDHQVFAISKALFLKPRSSQ